MKDILSDDNKILVFHDWLRGIVDNVDIKLKDSSILLNDSPKLSDKKASDIIYYLQEFLGVIPDKFEKCSRCGRIFDTESTGTHIDECDIEENEEFKKIDLGKFYCETCEGRVFYYQDRKKDRFDSSDGCSQYLIKHDVNVLLDETGSKNGE